MINQPMTVKGWNWKYPLVVRQLYLQGCNFNQVELTARCIGGINLFDQMIRLHMWPYIDKIRSQFKSENKITKTIIESWKNINAVIFFFFAT